MGSFLIEILDFVVMVLFLVGVARKIGSLFSPPRTRVQPSAAPRPTPRSGAAPHQGEMARDPVCGMFVATELSQKLKRGAETVHFCSSECMNKYQKDAEHAAS